MTWLALDIGGANLKAADGLGYAVSRPFALWRAPEQLAVELEALISAAPACERIAVTMTGELADCYPTKAAGVRSILDAVEAVAAGRRLSVYLTNGKFATPAEAREIPVLAAASNWHALASFANRFVPAGPALLIDMGSTTTDIIPLMKSGPCPAGLTDTDRLISGELVYTGIERTPVSSIVAKLPWREVECPVATELFATALDAYLLLGELPEAPHECDTADGRPRTRAAAHARMARMICADADSFSQRDAVQAARAIKEAQLAAIESAALMVASRLSQSPQSILLSGHGEFLLQELVNRLPWKCQVRSLSQELSDQVSRCAPAHALAVLACEASANRARR